MFMQSSGSRFGTGKQVRPVLGVLLFTAVVFVFAGCEGRKQVAAPPPPPEVLVAEVAQQDVPIYFEWLGTTDGYVNAQIRPRVQGYLQSQHYREGSFVQAGDPMFTIDPRVLRRASRDLIRHGLDVDDVSQIPMPDTGRSASGSRTSSRRASGCR